MKVLFAVSNEEISESIVKRYQKEYKEIISYKNVYYFNAILKELQKDKSYDRIVMVTFVTILVICQILPLAFAVVVKFGGR